MTNAAEREQVRLKYKLATYSIIIIVIHYCVWVCLLGGVYDKVQRKALPKLAI